MKSKPSQATAVLGEDARRQRRQPHQIKNKPSLQWCPCIGAMVIAAAPRPSASSAQFGTPHAESVIGEHEVHKCRVITVLAVMALSVAQVWDA